MRNPPSKDGGFFLFRQRIFFGGPCSHHVATGTGFSHLHAEHAARVTTQLQAAARIRNSVAVTTGRTWDFSRWRRGWLSTRTETRERGP